MPEVHDEALLTPHAATNTLASAAHSVALLAAAHVNVSGGLGGEGGSGGLGGGSGREGGGRVGGGLGGEEGEGGRGDGDGEEGGTDGAPNP